MAQRFLDICADCGTPTVCEMRRNGAPQCLACKAEIFFANVLFRPLGFQLLEWQKKVVRDIYGTLDPDSDLRSYRRAYVSMAKKQGKSFLIGGLPIYHLITEHDIKPEAYGAAAAKEQAGIVYRSAAEFVRRNKALQEVLRVLPSTRRIVRRDGAGFYTVISADGDLQDGIEPSLALVDELHRWKTAKAETLYDVMSKGMIARAEPLLIQITTAGEIYESPICYAEHEFAEQVLRGTVDSPRFYAAIWAADAKRAKTEPEYWKSREARVAANPSHEDNGGFLRDEALVEELDKAIGKPADKPKYMRYHLNLWVESEERAIDMVAWRAAAETRSLVDRVCYAGVDLSSSIDLTALVLVFPDLSDGSYDVLPFFWMPEENVAERERKDRLPYRKWIAEGALETTPGNVVDYSAVRKKLLWAQECFEVREIGYDPWNATQFVTADDNGLLSLGFSCVPVRQGYQTLSEPTKELITLVVGRRLRHGGNPVLTWNADCLTVRDDGNDNLRPVKPDRRKSSKRIDGMVATIIALSRAMAGGGATRSVYEDRGITMIE